MRGPRHWQVRCSANCGYTGTRAADAAVDVLKKPCPRCGKAVTPPEKVIINMSGSVRDQVL